MRPPPTPAERAQGAVDVLEREMAAVRDAVGRVRKAHAANDVEGWSEARARLDGALREASRGRERARAHAAAASNEVAARLEAVEGELEELAAEAGTLTEPPSGIARLAREAELEAVLAAPIAGSVAAGYQQKEASIRAELDRLSPAESRVLAERLRRARPNDAIAALFGRMTADRRGRLLGYLDDARRREAVRAARAPRLRAPEPTPLAQRSALSATEPLPFTVPAAAPSQPAPAAEEARPLPGELRGELESATGTSLGHVRVHAGERGGAVAAEHGARAVAIGGDIYMGEGRLDPSSPDGRELIAHEVAHVVQAQAHPGPERAAAKRDEDGAQAAEVDADLFASEFRRRGGAMSWRPAVSVAGGTALRAPLGPAIATARREVERLMPKPDVAWAYLHANRDRFLDAIVKRLATLALPAHERLAWVPGGVAAAFAGALQDSLDGDQLFYRMPELVHPGDPWYVIDHNRELVEGTPGRKVDGREPTGPLTWNPLAGDALAIEVALRVRESLARMAPRFAAQLDEKHPAPVTVVDLVKSHPMDRVTARLLCDERVVRPVARKRGAAGKPASEPAAFRDGLRILQDWRWLGEQDPRLWNWLEVKDPTDARAEEVAAMLLHRTGEPPSHLAYGITAAPPYFRFDPKWARMILGDAAPPSTGPDQPHRDDALALAESGLASEAAIAQAADERRYDERGIPLPPDLDRLGAQLERSFRQLERAKELLIPSRLWENVLPALHWVARHREHLLALPDGRLVKLTPVIEGQQEILFEAVGAVQDVVAAGGRAAEVDGDTGPITDVLRRYAVAIGESHLIDTARAHLATAREAKAGLTLALMDRSLRNSHGAVRELKASETPTMHYGGDAAMANAAAYHRQILELRGRHAAGETIDPGDVELLAANLKEHALEARVKSLYLQLHNLREEVRDSTSGFFGTVASAFEGAAHGLSTQLAARDDGIRRLPPKLSAMIEDLRDTVLAGWASDKAGRLRGIDPRDKRSRALMINLAASSAQDKLDAFIARHGVASMIRSALEALQAQQTRTRAIQIAVQIAVLVGVSIAGGILGNVVAGAVRGALLADAAAATTGMLRVAQVAGRTLGLATDAAVNAGGPRVLAGGGAADAWVDNFLSSGAVLIALRPLHNAAAAWGAAKVAPKAMSLWERTGHGAKVALRAGAVLTAEMLTGAAVAYMIHQARGKAPDEQTAARWAIEGASIAIGKFVSLKLRDLESRLVALAEHGAHLRRRAARARRTADEVERTGDKDRAMEVLAEPHRFLQEEADLLDGLHRIPGLRLAPETVAALRAGNLAEREALRGKAFSTLPLRLAGLSPDDASGKVWVGSTEDIAIALHQASRTGLEVKVLDHDAGARQWRVLYNDEQLTIIERKLHGQPREAKAHVTDADRAHARRYAEAAEFMQGQWEARTKAEIDAREVIEFDHLQVGHSIAGVVNQATLPASGEGLGRKLVVYQHRGTLAGRGGQELGQDPSKWDAPGIRGSEQAREGASWITSEEHGRSLDIGRLEVQTPAYRGSVIELERRPAGPAAEGADPWKVPHRALRVKVRDAGGKERWFYTDRFDNTGGMGPGDLRYVKAVTEPQQLDAMLAKHQILRGEDPDYASKVKPGEIFVWGGTPTGAWAAEPAARAPGSKATIMGDTRPATNDWPKLLEEYQAVTHAIARHRGTDVPAELARRKQEIEAQIAQAHGGMALRRNRKPGAAYDRGIQPGGGGSVRVAFGTPTRIAPAPDGRVVVTIGAGADARSTLYDQVIIAHGQDPGAPGAPGALLGAGAAEQRGPAGEATYGEVPEGTIALKPIWEPRSDGREPDIFGLESIDPPGIRLEGAAYATKKMSPWVKLSHRAKFEAAIDRMREEHATTRDHGAIGKDSKGVTTGIEHQRDRIPRANEVLAARAYRLPGPEHTLELDRANPARWDEQVREFFAIHLRANGQWVKVQRMAGGRSKAIVYRVWVDENDVGVFKLFDGKEGAASEQAMLKRLEQAKLTRMKAVKERGRISTDPKTGYQGGGLLMDTAKGTSIRELVEQMPADPALRKPAFDQLTAAMKRAAEGLAEMHAKFETKGTGGAPVMMSKEAKLSDANHLLDKSFRDGGEHVAKVRAALGDADFSRVKATLEGPMLRSFLDADVPATAYHGDANAGNFVVHDYKEGKGYKDLGVIDVGSMRYSLDEKTGKGIKTGAADVARLLGSLETLNPGQLTSAELGNLRGDFMEAYLESYQANARHDLNLVKYEQAERWYRLELEVTVLKSDSSARQRILQILGLKASP